MIVVVVSKKIYTFKSETSSAKINSIDIFLAPAKHQKIQKIISEKTLIPEKKKMEGQEKMRWSFEESDLNNIDADHRFKAEQSESDEVQYLSRRNSITQQ